MKLFHKAFIILFCFMVFVVLFLSFILSRQHISDAEDAIIEQNRIYGDIISKQIEVGYLQSDWPFENLNKLSKRENFLFWWVVKQDGTIYRANNVSFIGTRALDYFPEVKEIVDDSVYINKVQKYAIYFKNFRIGQDVWTFWLGFSLESVTRKTYSIITTVAIVLIFVLAVLAMVLYFAVAFLTKPIENLRDTTLEIAKGNLDIKTKIKSDDEIGDLAESFNSMTQMLKKSRKDLEKYSINLEKEVKKRTKELEVKNDELERFNKMAVGRELKMIELKKRINEFEEKKK